MEAIKCPNCGSEKVQELTEEKYVCLACDNVFLVHNLSKEFRQTDEHIDVVHRELKEAINNLAVNDGSSAVDAEIENAFHLIEIQKYDIAWEKFEELCVEHSMTYRPWWGMFLAMTSNLDSLDEELICSQEVIDCITNMRKCSDYTQETEEKLCCYLDEVFADNKRDIEQKLSNLQALMADTENEIKEKRLKKTELEGKSGEIDNLKKKIEKMNLARTIVTGACLLWAEWRVIVRLFIGWLGKSIGVVTAPLPDASASEAGSAFGGAVLNFLAIPVKFVIGVVVAMGVAVLIFKVLRNIFETAKQGTYDRIDKYYDDMQQISDDMEDLKNEVDNYKTRQSKLQKHIELYGSISNSDLSTFERYRKIKENYQDEDEYEDKVFLCIISAGDKKEEVVDYLAEVWDWTLAEIQDFLDDCPNCLFMERKDAEDGKEYLQQHGVEVYVAELDEAMYLKVSSIMAENKEKVIDILSREIGDEEIDNFLNNLPDYLCGPKECMGKMYEQLTREGAEVQIMSVAEYDAETMCGRGAEEEIQYESKNAGDDSFMCDSSQENQNDTAKMFCPACGNRVYSAAQFCEQCGSKL